MKKHLLTLMLAGLMVLVACQSPAATETPLPSATMTLSPPTLTPTATLTMTPSVTPTPAPEVRVSEIVNQVQVRVSSADDFQAVLADTTLPLQGDLQTFTESSARLDVLPDGTLVRVGPETLIHLDTLQHQDNGILTRIQMWAGEIWVVLKGGSLDVETPDGVAAVRGSLMRVQYQAENHVLVVSCLEGHCALSNELGSVELSDGEAARVLGSDVPPSEPVPMTTEDYQTWLNMVPEAQAYITPELLTPTVTMIPSPLPTWTLEPPVTYYLVNNCAQVWHWKFTGPTTIFVDVAAHSVAGGALLPVGAYSAIDWFDGGSTTNTNTVAPGGHIQASACD